MTFHQDCCLYHFTEKSFNCCFNWFNKFFLISLRPPFFSIQILVSNCIQRRFWREFIRIKGIYSSTFSSTPHHNVIVRLLISPYSSVYREVAKQPRILPDVLQIDLYSPGSQFASVDITAAVILNSLKLKSEENTSIFMLYEAANCECWALIYSNCIYLRSAGQSLQTLKTAKFALLWRIDCMRSSRGTNLSRTQRMSFVSKMCLLRLVQCAVCLCIVDSSVVDTLLFRLIAHFKNRFAYL